MSSVNALAPSSYSNRSEPARRGRIGGPLGRARQTRSTSSSSTMRNRSSSRNGSRSRSRQRSRSTSMSKRRGSVVHFEEPHGNSRFANNPGGTGHDMDDITVIFTTSVTIGSQRDANDSEHTRKRHRFRSSSVKRRSRPIYRDTQPRRKREARAPSRSKTPSQDLSRGHSTINKQTRRHSARARSRSPFCRHSSLHWFTNVKAENAPPQPIVSTATSSEHEEFKILRTPRFSAPPLRLMASDDIHLLNTHKQLQEEFGIGMKF